MKLFMVLFLYLVVATAQAQSQTPVHGMVKENAGSKLQVWNDENSEWTDLDTFWVDFAKSNDAKYWGQTDTYPNYDDVKQFDTVLIQIEQGNCLMQFFHSRWRRANDVQRWDDAFNEYAGCPSVFE
jgi:hypothetical protein